MRAREYNKRSARGVTLIELIVAIVIFGIAATSLMGAMSAIAKNSAERMVRDQAEAIAYAYLERVVGQPFNTIHNWNGMNQSGAYDQFGNLITDQYQIAITAQNVNGFGTAVKTVPAANVFRIDVRVSHPSGVSVLLTAFRTQHP
jgi:MSHA pilin protein MshD